MFTTQLPATKSSQFNSLAWTADPVRPREGLLTVGTAKAITTYAVTELETAWEGRAFKLEIVRGGTDPESEFYHVFVANNPQDRSCDCKGFVYGRGKPCKHVTAVEALLESNQI
jgi:hypothetical protein